VKPRTANRSPRPLRSGTDNVIDIRSRDGETRALETFLRERFRDLSVPVPLGVEDTDGQSSGGYAIPFSIRVTLQELLTVADDADLRAQLLSASVEGTANGRQGPRKVESLHAIAASLRTTAARLLTEAWLEARDLS